MMARTNALTKETLFDLSGRVALVTGGGSGIGLMAAQTLAANGARVYVCGRTEEKLERAAAHGAEASGEIIPIQADLSSKDGIRALVDEVAAREKRLCILVNNAGISSQSLTVAEAKSAAEVKKNLFDSEQSTFADWTKTYHTNVASVFFTTTAFLPLLQASTERHPGWSGTVINISSISGLVKTAQHHFSYNASKAAAVHLTRMLSSELAAAGLKIRVNGIAPGVFPSEMTADDSDAAQKSSIPKHNFEGKVPANRPGKDEDMASAILFAACNQYLNGDTVIVDGGYTVAFGM